MEISKISSQNTTATSKTGEELEELENHLPSCPQEKQTTNSQYSYEFARYQMILKMANHYTNVPPPGETEGFISTFLSH